MQCRAYAALETIKNDSCEEQQVSRRQDPEPMRPDIMADKRDMSVESCYRGYGQDERNKEGQGPGTVQSKPHEVPKSKAARPTIKD